jgi:lysophospholipase L1-like esterase
LREERRLRVFEKRDTVTIESRKEKCLVLGDSIVWNVGADRSDMRIECFPGIRTDQLRRVIENRDLGCSDSVVIHVGTNDVRRFRNLDLVMGEAYDLVNTAKTKFPGSRLVVSGVLRSRGVSWQRVGAANDRLEWIAGALGTTFVDPNSWIREEDFGRDGLHLNRSGARQLGELYS